ncbi:pyruvate ferredoxin oxidoreductase [Telmatospirillum siberiense]|uniref:Pyruvate ferredoxin oxidoreductase n=1 Tax=Telmatospirillum siberiense TaxID=382514 RepID=A0A2N3PMN2_9PROT|nr:pyruvate ferredoxin oxidoreductase [Telmatospirillum siberiense]PKU21669.1 pyruvate ferredoxin oxidoreductase [Telmatospirillum siberiense]
MSELHFLSGNEAVAQGVRLSRPRVIAAYPITPQTIVVERLSEMVESRELAAEFVHVESEHSALALVMGSAAMGVRTFTATSSQGLMYMAECLHYTSGGRFPLVMMNANRSLALPWNIYGDQSDSLALLSSGWIQVYAETAQESLDMIIQAYAVAEDVRVRTPVLVNLDGFVLTHTYEPVIVPDQDTVDAFLPPPDFPPGYPGTFDLLRPQSLAVSAGPGDYAGFKYRQHRDMVAAAEPIRDVGGRFAEIFGRGSADLIEPYRCGDAELVMITLGSIAGTVRDVIDDLRADGLRVGLLRIRYLRPFPSEDLRRLLFGPLRRAAVAAIGILEKDISFGHQGGVALEVKAALYDQAEASAPAGLPPVRNFIAGLGGQDISRGQIIAMFDDLARAAGRDGDEPARSVRFVGLEASR